MTQTQLQKTHEERLDVGEGLTIFVRSWRPEASARGVVVIVPVSTRTAAITAGPPSSWWLAV